MQRELSGLCCSAAEDQQRYKRGACAEHGQARTFEATVSAIVKEKCAAAAVEPDHPEKKSHVADTRGDECLLCSGRGTRSLDPEPDQQIGSEPDKFPKNEKQKQTVRDDQPEHRAGEEREIREKAGEIFVIAHQAAPEDKNPNPHQRNHHEHRGSQRIEQESETRRLVVEGQPTEVLNGTKAGGLQRWHKRQDRERECE